LRIKGFQVEGYRSLRNVDLNDLSNLNVLIGKNGSGKSNVLEALNLFFSEFSATGGTTQGFNEYYWFRGQKRDPIEFIVKFELTDEEIGQIFSADVLSAAKVAFGDAYRIMTIGRKILNPEGSWSTAAIFWTTIPLVQTDVASVAELTQALVVDKAPDSDKAIQMVPPQITPQFLNEALARLTNKIKGSFRLVPVTRDGRNPDKFRTTLTDDNVQTKIWALDQSIVTPEEERYSAYEDSFGELTGLRLDPAQGKLMIKKGTKRFPLGLEGGGIQSSSNLLFGVLIDGEGVSIFGIEEPETHFHPELQRKLVKQLRKMAENRQIFVATHSPIFISDAPNSKVFLTKLTGNETEIVETGGLSSILEEVGARPSDLLFSNKIIFVEGESDRLVLEAYARRLGLDLTGIELIPIRGKSNSSRALDTWIGIAKKVIPLYFILDKDAAKEAEAVLRTGSLEKSQVHVWRDGCIENYYGPELISEALDALNKRYPSLDLDSEKIVKEIASGKLKPDEISIGSKKELLDKSWEVELGSQVAKLIREGKGTVPEEIEETLIAATSSTY